MLLDIFVLYFYCCYILLCYVPYSRLIDCLGWFFVSLVLVITLTWIDCLASCLGQVNMILVATIPWNRLLSWKLLLKSVYLLLKPRLLAYLSLGGMQYADVIRSLRVILVCSIVSIVSRVSSLLYQSKLYSTFLSLWLYMPNYKKS